MKKIGKILISFILSVLLCYKHHLLYIPNIELNTKYHFQVYVDIILFIFMAFYIFNLLIKTENKKITKIKVVFLCILNLFLLISNTFITSGDLSFLYKNIYNILYNILLFFIQYFVLKRTLIYIEDKVQNEKIKELKHNKIFDLFNKYPFWFSFCFLLLCWLIYIIAFYPIILSPDPSFQIKQFFNIPTKYADYAILLDKHVFLTNHHPVVHTLLLGGCLSLGRILLNDNFGLFLYSFIQFIFLASTLSYLIKYLKENKINNKIIFIVLCVYAFVPMFPLYSMSGVKDTIYTCFIIWYVIFIDKIIRNKNNTSKNFILLFIICIGVSLFRNNGIYVLFLSLPFLIWLCKKHRIQLIAVFIGILGFYGVFSKIILPTFKITDGSIRETLSIPFQQTARYVKYYSSDLTKEEIKTIDKILGYDTLAKRYKPNISDPVKNEFNKYTTKEELKEYFKVWLKCFFRHPLVYIEATLSNIYGYFSPQDTNWYIYYKYDTRITENNLVNYHYNSLNNVRMILSGFGQAYPYIPGIGLISNIGFNTWLLLGLTFYSAIKKRKDLFVLLTPLLISLLVCVASPVNTYFRYTMPYIFSMPFLVPIVISRLKETKN